MSRFSRKTSNFIIPVCIGVFNLLLLLFPRDVLEAARQGLGLWFNNVLPSLTPFIIGTNVLVAMGAVGSLGRLLDRLMQPLFRLPGAGGFALATGMLAGYPLGARSAATLTQSGHLTPRQASRLAGFCNNSGPLFVVGAVGTGMFGSSGIGFFVLACHYLASLGIGLAGARLSIKAKEPASIPLPKLKTPRKPFGQILGESVQSAMETIVVVGGFIILFCVIARILDILGLFEIKEWLLAPILPEAMEIPLRGLAIGLIEITNGAAALAENPATPWNIATLAFVISFGGFSIHAQSLSFLSKAGVPAMPYLLGKLCHGITAAILAFAGWQMGLAPEAAPAFLQQDAGALQTLGYSSSLFAVALLAMFTAGALLGRKTRRRQRRW